MKHDSHELVWAAGLFEGEGSIYIRDQRGVQYQLGFQMQKSSSISGAFEEARAVYAGDQRIYMERLRALNARGRKREALRARS